MDLRIGPALFDRAAPEQVGREGPFRPVADQARVQDLNAGVDERGGRPCLASPDDPAGTTSSSASIVASSQRWLSSLIASTGPSIHRLSLLTTRIGSSPNWPRACTSPPPVSISCARSSLIATSIPSNRLVTCASSVSAR
ncbi:hypothetical protein WR25_23663 [Diploscapter pachys]|uniref:Uncharacterized protein n=1 Tax=Diploscapter pachys TaxID=2018661 RepID=A0A2A2KLE2_9BILA|nr:hypothetical protein WR25_23663 [Diploscapter pachys]